MQILCSRSRLLFLSFFFLKASRLQRNVRFFGSFLNSQRIASFVLTGELRGSYDMIVHFPEEQSLVSSEMLREISVQLRCLPASHFEISCKHLNVAKDSLDLLCP